MIPRYVKNMIITRNLNNLKKDNLKESLNVLFLLDQNFKSILQTLPVDEFVSQMIKTIISCVEKFAPEKNVLSVRNEKQWNTNKIRNAIKKRDPLYR